MTVEKKIRDTFGLAFRVVAEKGLFDHVVIMPNVEEKGEDQAVVDICPDVGRTISLDITKIEIRTPGSEWVVTVRGGNRFSFRQSNESEAFVKFMRDAGMRV